MVSGATSGVPTSTWRFSCDPSGTSRGLPLNTCPFTITVTLPWAWPTLPGPTGCPRPPHHLALLPVHEDRQVRVNGKHRLLAGLPADPVNGLPGGRGRRPRELG